MAIQLRDEKTGQIEKEYTEEQEKFIKEYYPWHTPEETAEAFNEKFGCTKTVGSIMTKARRLKARCFVRSRGAVFPHKWEEEHVRYVAEIFEGRPVTETTKMLNEKFGTDYSWQAVKCVGYSLGLKVGMNSGGFKKGNRSLKADPIGTVKFVKFNGAKRMMFIKVSDEPQSGSGLCHKNWKLYKNYVWEQNKGEIPKGHFIACADGDEQNCDISNLRCIPTKYVQNLTRYNKWYGKGQEILDAGIAWCELNEELKKYGMKLED